MPLRDANEDRGLPDRIASGREVSLALDKGGFASGFKEITIPQEKWKRGRI
jgi:hypothetical protein